MRRAVAALAMGGLLFAAAVQAREVPEAAVAILPSGAEFVLEIAADPESRAQGYMFREHVGPREGMLFLFDADHRQPFWMKNCRVPLDILWLDDKLRIVHIAPDQPPCPEDGECHSVRPMRAARYVLEFAGGTVRAQKLKLGDPIVVLSEPPLF